VVVDENRGHAGSARDVDHSGSVVEVEDFVAGQAEPVEGRREDLDVGFSQSVDARIDHHFESVDRPSEPFPDAEPFVQHVRDDSGAETGTADIVDEVVHRLRTADVAVHAVG
jgi:hypothetical protein